MDAKTPKTMVVKKFLPLKSSGGSYFQSRVNWRLTSVPLTR